MLLHRDGTEKLRRVEDRTRMRDEDVPLYREGPSPHPFFVPDVPNTATYV